MFERVDKRFDEAEIQNNRNVQMLLENFKAYIDGLFEFADEKYVTRKE